MNLFNPLKTTALQLHFYMREQSEVARCQISQIGLIKDLFDTLLGLFLHMKMKLKVHRFERIEEIQKESQVALYCIEKNFPAVENEVGPVHCSAGGLLRG